MCSVSGGGCHCTMMDWLVLPLATMFFGGALGGSSGNINLKIKIYQRERKTRCSAQSLVEEKSNLKHAAGLIEAVYARAMAVNMPGTARRQWQMCGS